MPKIEDLERLGSIAFLIGNKALPKEISQNDYDHFKSVFTDEHMANSLPAEDNGLPSIDDLDSLDFQEDDNTSDDNDTLELPEDLGLDDDNASDDDILELPEDLGLDDDNTADDDTLELPEDLALDDNNASDDDILELPEDLGLDDNNTADDDTLELPEDLGADDDKVSADIDNLDLPEDLGADDDKVSADIDNLDLPEDLGTDDDKVSADIDNLDLPEDLGADDDKVSADIDDLDLPEDLGADDDKVSADIDNLDLPEDLSADDDKVSADIDNLDLPEDLGLDTDDLGLPEDLGLDDDDKLSADIDDLELPEDKELEDKIAMDINNDNSKENDIHSEKLPVLDDLPLPETLSDIDENQENNSQNEGLPIIEDDNNDNIELDDISDSLDDILEGEDASDIDDLENILDGDNKAEEDTDIKEDETVEDDHLDNLENILDDDNKAEEDNAENKEDDHLDNLENILDDDNKAEEDNVENKEDDHLDNLENILDDDDKAEEDTAAKEDETQEDDHLDNLESILDDEDKAEEDTAAKEEQTEEDKNDDIDLDDTAEEEIAAKEDETQEDDHLDNLENILDDGDESDNKTDDTSEEDTAAKEEQTEEDKNDDIDLDDLSLDDAAEEYAANKELEANEEDKNDDIDDLSLDDAIEETDGDITNNIVEGGTTLPPPEIANNLPASKYADLDKDIDHDKVINAIKYLSPLTQYHVLDAILNEKLDRISMETLLNALERGESNDTITELLNRELGLSIKEEGRKNALDLIPIPNSLKDYAKIIRVAAVFLVLFVGIVLFSFQFIYKPVMANKYYKQGLVSISKGAYDEAERNFAQGENLKPKQIKWYNKYARAYIDRETFNYALKKIQGALDIKPRDFETRITYGYYHRKKGEKELSEEDYIAGEELYDDMLVYTEKKKQKEIIYDERGLIMISRAKNLLDPEYYDIAYNNYRDMVNFFGDGVIPRKRAMLIKIYQDDYEQVKLLQNHINLLKKGYIDDDVYPKLAKYLLDKDDFYGSRVLFENLLTAYPNNLESIVGYADYETRLKHYDRAMEILSTGALPLYESNPFYRGKEYVYNMLGQIYYNLGEYGNAVKNFNEALSINEVYPDANYNLGNVYFYKEKDYEKAKKYYQTAYDNLAPSLRSDKLLYNLSWIYYSDEEYDRAFEGFNALFQKNPSNSVVSYALGNSLLHLDKANLANGFYRNALSQVLSKRDRLGRLEMRTEADFILVSYLASLYNNIGVSYAHSSIVTNTIVNEQEAFKHFVLASEYFDQVRTSNIDLERMEKRTILVDNQNVGAASYNIMSMQGKRNLKQATIIDDYIPKDMYYVR